MAIHPVRSLTVRAAIPHSLASSTALEYYISITRLPLNARLIFTSAARISLYREPTISRNSRSVHTSCLVIFRHSSPPTHFLTHSFFNPIPKIREGHLSIPIVNSNSNNKTKLPSTIKRKLCVACIGAKEQRWRLRTTTRRRHALEDKRGVT